MITSRAGVTTSGAVPRAVTTTSRCAGLTAGAPSATSADRAIRTVGTWLAARATTRRTTLPTGPGIATGTSGTALAAVTGVAAIACSA